MSDSSPKKLRLKRAASSEMSQEKDLGPIALIGPIIQNVVTPLGLEQADEDVATDELNWLLFATNHLLTLHKKLETEGVLDGSQAIGHPIPASATQTSGQATNQLVTEATMPGFSLEESVQILWQPALETPLQGINIYLAELSTLLGHASAQGAMATADAGLQNQITDQRIAIVSNLKTMAETLNEAYTILVTAPDHLLAVLEKKEVGSEPIALGSLVNATVIPSFGLETEGEDWVDEEINWLFSAVDNLFAAYRRLEMEGSLESRQTIAAAAPAEIEKTVATASNQLLADVEHLQPHAYSMVEEFLQYAWYDSLATDLEVIHTHLNNLQGWLAQSSQLGEASNIDFATKDKIKNARLAILKAILNITNTIDEAYGMRITSPEELLTLLEEEG